MVPFVGRLLETKEPDRMDQLSLFNRPISLLFTSCHRNTLGFCL